MEHTPEKTPHESLTICKRRAPRIASKEWRMMVDFRFRQGFGCEDIAIQLHCDLEAVRFYMRRKMASASNQIEG